MRRFMVVIGLLATLSAGAAAAGEVKLGALTIVEPWARATIGQGKNGVAYLTILNSGQDADRLLSVATPAAKKASLHTHLMEGGMMKMRAVSEIEIKGRASTILKPGGLHLMLMGLTAPLKEGGIFPLTLTFEKAGSVEVVVPIAAATAKRPGGTTSAGKMPHGKQHAAMAHDHSKPIELPPGADLPTLEVEIAKDTVGGWNLHIITTNFRFAPEHASGKHRTGEGHAHVYVNDKKIARVYGPWFHIASLPEGTNQVRVTLNANDHRAIAIAGEPVSKTVEVHVQ